MSYFPLSHSLSSHPILSYFLDQLSVTKVEKFVGSVRAEEVQLTAAAFAKRNRGRKIEGTETCRALLPTCDEGACE